MTAAFVDYVLSRALFSVLCNPGDDVQFTDFFSINYGHVLVINADHDVVNTNNHVVPLSAAKEQGAVDDGVVVRM